MLKVKQGLMVFDALLNMKKNIRTMKWGTVNIGNINGEKFKFGLAVGTYLKNLKKKTSCNHCKRYSIIRYTLSQRLYQV